MFPFYNLLPLLCRDGVCMCIVRKVSKVSRHQIVNNSFRFFILLYYLYCLYSHYDYVKDTNWINSTMAKWHVSRDISCYWSRQNKRNTPGTRGGPGVRDRTLAVKEKNAWKLVFFRIKIKLTTLRKTHNFGTFSWINLIFAGFFWQIP